MKAEKYKSKSQMEWRGLCPSLTACFTRSTDSHQSDATWGFPRTQVHVLVSRLCMVRAVYRWQEQCDQQCTTPIWPFTEEISWPLDLVRPEGIIFLICSFLYTLILSLVCICSKSRFSLIYKPTKHILTGLCICDEMEDARHSGKVPTRVKVFCVPSV